MKRLPSSSLCFAFLFMGFFACGASAAMVTISDYLVSGKPGDIWTYTYTHGPQAGTDFTVTEPLYESIYPLFPTVAETGQLIPFEPHISNIYEIVNSFTVPAGTFNDVLVVIALDDRYPSNFVNSDFGLDPAIIQGVTDVIWFARGQSLGEVEFAVRECVL